MTKLLEKLNKESKNLGSLLEVTSSKRIYLSEYKDSGIPFFRSKEIIEASKGRDISSELYISNERYEEVKNKFGVPQIGDVLLTSIGTIGIPFIVKDNTPFYFKDGNLTWFKNYNGINPSFLYYWIVSPKGQSRIESSSIGSSQSALTIDSIKKLQIDLPDLPTQKKIAKILSAYDAKIENNNFIIKKLEATAQTLFDEWFVNFRFPGYEKAKFVNSEMGEIPEGWEIKNIKDIFTVILGGTPSREKPEYWNGHIPWINSGEVNKLRILEATEHITELGLSKSNARLIKTGATVLAITGATLGQVSRLEIDSTANQSVVGIFDEKDILNEYLYLYITHNILDLISGASGGAQQHINKQMVENYKILIPSEIVIKDFNKKVKPNFLLIKKLFEENISLKSQRDQLLAKLI